MFVVTTCVVNSINIGNPIFYAFSFAELGRASRPAAYKHFAVERGV